MSQSKISSNINLEKDGKQFGYLRAPHSTNTSGWGSMLIPVVCIKNGDGPTVLFTGGNHGDEFEGPVSLLKLGRNLESSQIEGRVIILPALNYPALMAGVRLSPVDGKNMNRAFPGDPGGTITTMIADYVMREFVTVADAVIDLHSGGSSMVFAPTTVIHFLNDEHQMKRCFKAAEAFGAPYTMIVRELDAVGMLDSSVENTGKTFVSTELGGGAFLSPETIAVADRGLSNVLIHLGVLAGEPDSSNSRVMETPDEGAYFMAECDGLYEPVKEVGQAVKTSEVLGRIHDPDRPDIEAADICALCNGVLMTRAGRGWVRRGDTISVVAVDCAYRAD